MPANFGVTEAALGPGLGVACSGIDSGSAPDRVRGAEPVTEKVGTVEIAAADGIIPRAVGKRQVTVEIYHEWVDSTYMSVRVVLIMLPHSALLGLLHWEMATPSTAMRGRECAEMRIRRCVCTHGVSVWV